MILHNYMCNVIKAAVNSLKNNVTQSYGGCGHSLLTPSLPLLALLAADFIIMFETLNKTLFMSHSASSLGGYYDHSFIKRVKFQK